MSARAMQHPFAIQIPLAGWAWSALRPFTGLVARSPLTTATLALVVFGYAYAGVNALYLQAGARPVPFYEREDAQAAIERQLQAIPALVEETRLAPPRAIDPAPTESLRRTAVPVDVPGQVVGNPETFRVQSMLKSLGFFSEEIDGYYGPRTAEAIRGFEAQAGLSPTGAMEPVMVAALEQAYVRGTVRQSLSAAPAIPAEPIPEPVQRVAANDPLAEIVQTAVRTEPQAAAPNPQRDLVMTVQRGLASLGFLHGPIDGIAGEATAKAIRNFEVFNNYRVTGEVTPELVDLLRAADAAF